MKIAIIGVTGLVGKVMLKILEERDFPVSHLIPVASDKSIGKKITFKKQTYAVESIEEGLGRNPDMALFSAGASVSKKWAPEFAKRGCFVIDNSSAWRMNDEIPLIVPEINADILSKKDKIISNPNCSTIQMVVALNPIFLKYGIKRLVISTYQSFTGTGMKAVQQYNQEKNGQTALEFPAYPHPIFENCLPHCDVFNDNGYTKEELKLVNETKKIFRTNHIGITSTAVRVPVSGGHSESINVELEKEFILEDVINLLKNTSGIIVQNNHENNEYPMPLWAKNKDDVFVGRIRRDHSISNGLNLWVVADNLRKGAATNAVQIAEYLINSEIVEENEVAIKK